jgi:ribosomal protein S18 acetylase RimI-like enzyme
MATVTVRPMTRTEFDEWQLVSAEEYAEEQVKAGRWAAEGAVERAREESALALPDGLETERMLLFTGLDAAGEPVGRAWVSLDHPRGAPDVAFLYDIGLGRALLSAVEAATRGAGASALELNVFGSNRPAVLLYASAGYDVVTQQMRKTL